ncbi:hypothetical protein CRG98_002362 [Punica granatum]|uniref:Uncharacterized protein n=1 Tax=Punica granatum TaxID=22663 RepID=A0A2I0L980_PUNGR|nr:hypothetical protein CRG98_002362 [Punica granatum]
MMYSEGGPTKLYSIICLLLSLLTVVHLLQASAVQIEHINGGSTPFCNGTVADCSDSTEELLLDPQSSKKGGGNYISYAGLKHDQPVCGAVAYSSNCVPARANGYTKPCTKHSTIKLTPDTQKSCQLNRHALYIKIIPDIDLSRKPIANKLIEYWSLTNPVEGAQVGKNSYLFHFELAADRRFSPSALVCLRISHHHRRLEPKHDSDRNRILPSHLFGYKFMGCLSTTSPRIMRNSSEPFSTRSSILIS